jgi:hypothetical protein
MSTRPRTSVYLSGWEYNRLLQEDPAQPRVSALPASILWNGSHQLWMFENVYCTRESFENEVEATDRLGWVNGTVLRDLADEGILRTVDWQELPVEIKDRLRRARSDTLSVLSEDQIRSSIQTGDASTLELAKAAILEPILDFHGCIESGAPNSITNWISVSHENAQDVPEGQPGSLSDMFIRGIQVCRPAGTGISDEARRRQQHAQDTVEKPMIPRLLAGEMEFQGARGFDPYLRQLARVKDAYEATNTQLNSDWAANKNSLFRLRDAASKYLWPDLHGYWLPRLSSQDDHEAGQDFEKWIRSALRIAPVVRYLEGRPTKVIVGAFGPPALAVALAHAGIPWPDAVVGGGLAAIGGSGIKRHFDQVTRLALFFQQTRQLTVTSGNLVPVRISNRPRVCR